MCYSYLDEKDLTRIAVRVEDLYNKAKELKDGGEKIALLSISEPMPEVELGKTLDVWAIGSSLGGISDCEFIEVVSKEEIDETDGLEDDDFLDFPDIDFVD